MGSHEFTLDTASICGTQIHPVLPKQRDKSVFFVQIMEKRFQVELLRKRMFWASNGSRTHDLPHTGWTL